MPKLRRLSGDEVIAILQKFDFKIHSQRGSHIKLKRSTPDGGVQSTNPDFPVVGTILDPDAGG
ncbi:type II toxin-antitoxin system HicA family toxin [candidate division WOR-3 bacterium]|uniref:Type II toxin-antitoxin system HicA family toxin n=1 Tax=candidate division WOR-3 bacterium TaxID=2052148 RepID=A0A660SMX5_UNCW3|nr:MAG: type II toxin-antitoxin system HicA family toxin [candidate division WOR-3 bacterium]